jgi:diphthamide biosynthesis methyltransferase
MPKWLPEKNFKPTSFIDIVKQNQSIQAHTLLLVDINLDFEKAKQQLRETFTQERFKEKLLVCSSLGTEKQKIQYNGLDKMKKADKPFCFIIPCNEKDLHFAEKEFLNNF